MCIFRNTKTEKERERAITCKESHVKSVQFLEARTNVPFIHGQQKGPPVSGIGWPLFRGRPDQGLSQYFPAQGIPPSLQSDLKWSSSRSRRSLGKQPSQEECQSAACPPCDQLGNTPASYNRNSVHLCLDGVYFQNSLNSAENQDDVFFKHT